MNGVAEKVLVRWLGVVSVAAGMVLAGCSGSGPSNTTTTPLVVATPGFSVVAGTYTSVQTVGITDATVGATIYYTTNGTTPTTGSAVYSGPVSVSASETLEAIAVASGDTNSSVASAAYVINLPPVANAGGPYMGIEGVALSFNGSGSSSPQGKTLTYAWSFGDGATAAVASPTHTYAAWGAYTATLTVTDTSNLSNTATVLVNVPNGRAFGSQKTVAGAHVYVLAANTTGYGGAALSASSANASVSLLSAANTGTSDAIGAYVTTSADGSFFINGDYSCTPGSQVYLYALGGSTGAGTNTAIGLLAALGMCPSGGSFAATPYVVMNEVSTIAAAYAFAGFATDATHVGSSGTALAQVGIANAFANVTNLETLGTGAALAMTPAGNGTVPQAEINTLANTLASCTGTGSSVSAGCSLLLGYALSGGTTGATPTDTATAGIDIAHNPGTNVANLFAVVGSGSPFTPKLTAVPNDWTVGITLSGGGLVDPSAIAIDGNGNAWMTNQMTNSNVNLGMGSLTEFSSSGAALSPATGFTGGGLQLPEAVSIDRTGNVWVGSLEGLSEFSNAGASIATAADLFGGGLDFVGGSITMDGNGDVWATNYPPSNTVSEFSAAGSAISSSSGYALASGSTSGGDYQDQIAIDGGIHVWALSSYFDTVTELSQSGTVLQHSGGAVVPDPDFIAIDGTGNLWITSCDYLSSGTLNKLSVSGTTVSVSGVFPLNGDTRPCGAIKLAIDGGGNVWTAYLNTIRPASGLVEFANSGAAMSPANGYAYSSANLLNSVAVDGSGNVWTTTSSGSAIEVIGAATPVITPIAAGLPATPTIDGSSNLGTRP